MIDNLIHTALRFTLPFPVSVNGMYGKSKEGKRFLIASAREFKDKSILIGRNAANVAEWRYTPGQSLKIVCTFYFADKRVADLDNLLKLSIDAIKVALQVDDNWQVIGEVTARAGGVDKHNPRCEVVVKTIAEAHHE